MFDKLQDIARRTVAALGLSPRVTGDYWAGSRGRPTQAGVSVNEQTALGISAVWGAVNLYAGTIAGLNLEVAERNERGGSSAAPDHWAYDLLYNRPNSYQSSYDFWQTIVGHSLTYGNGYAEIEWMPDGRSIRQLHLIDPRTVTPNLGIDRKLTYKLRNYDAHGTLDSVDMLHIRGFSFDGIQGYSPISIAREQLGTAMAQQVFEATTFGNGAQPKGHLEIPGNLNENQIAQQRSSWNAVHQGPANSNKIAILEGGMKWVQTSFSPADAQLLLARGFSVAEVARLYRVPPHMLGIMDGATVGNAEQQALQFKEFSLTPRLRSIERELNLKLFGPQERKRYFARFDDKSLGQGDTVARSTAKKMMFQSGVISSNEWRLSEGWNALDTPGADWHWVGTNNLAPIETMPATGPLPATQPAASKPKEPSDDDQS